MEQGFESVLGHASEQRNRRSERPPPPPASRVHGVVVADVVVGSVGAAETWTGAPSPAEFTAATSK